ncbi:hypothetical protein [uncultured Catenibacterium sp.]|uniref:hypothetical protein n=1 Tax=uncultured Catenibacterium sp. TaxID=286142 RepID=UPI0025E4C8DA|nr:hypothetical protein [uncultured Catenibacterium sp.]
MKKSKEHNEPISPTINVQPICMGALHKEELNAEIEKGYIDILEGRTKHAKQAFNEMRKDFNL